MATIKLSKQQWEFIGTKTGWLQAGAKKKKKKWNPNPWAICTESVGRENKEKYERCVMDVKEKQK